MTKRMGRLNILVLHCLGNPALAPSFLSHHVFALRKNCPGHNYLYHDATLPLPGYVVEQNFDAIVLDVSFLTARWIGADYLQARKNAYAFVRDSTAAKIAFPQDEYDCNVLLDDWMCEWKVDVVFSVVSSGWNVLYPRYHKCGDIRLGYTGYIDETLLDRQVKPFDARTIDIGYRAKKLPPYFGRIGETKWTIGRDVALQGGRAGLAVDIELGDTGTLFGDAWLDFIGNSKFTLGANSGSSLLDPTGDIQRNVRSFVADHPDASFEEVEAACFPGMEGHYSFTAISPRVLEAALLGSAQILVDGEYSGIVNSQDHFIPIRRDASNFSEVIAAMSDADAVERMIRRCREAVLSVDALRYRNKARMVIDLIGDLVSRKKTGANPEQVEKVISRYQEEMQPKYRAHWRRQHFRTRIARATAPYPMLYRALRSAAKILR
ncbi:MAG: hypothetical protein H6943_05950 [Zoogloeaceae bacterium]|nr:hypothetical protein [Zoogloeaceae bacterium]